MSQCIRSHQEIYLPSNELKQLLLVTTYGSSLLSSFATAIQKLFWEAWIIIASFKFNFLVVFEYWIAMVVLNFFVRYGRLCIQRMVLSRRFQKSCNLKGTGYVLYSILTSVISSTSRSSFAVFVYLFPLCSKFPHSLFCLWASWICL